MVERMGPNGSVGGLRDNHVKSRRLTAEPPMLSTISPALTCRQMSSSSTQTASSQVPFLARAAQLEVCGRDI